MFRWSLVSLGLVLGGLVGLVAHPLLHGQAPAPALAAQEPTSYRDLVKKVLPAVVAIETKSAPTPLAKKSTPKPQSPSDNPQVPEEFRKFFGDLHQQPDGLFKFFQNLPQENPRDVPRHGFGSGFLVEPDGVILTNNHVVDGAGQVLVHLQDGRTFPSKEVKTDPKTDLAIVRIDAPKPLPYLELGDSEAMEIGDRVLAVGAPFGLAGSVTAGIVSAKGRHVQMNMYEDFLQTDAAINPGNSGGPLVNLHGQVIGINTMIKTHSGGSQGVGLAIASNLARNVMDQLRRFGVVHRGYLGVQVQALDPEVGSRLGVAGDKGVVVAKVFEGTPAAKAGVQDGDVITALGGKPVSNPSDLQRLVADLPLGKPAAVSLVREGKARTVSVAVEEQPRQFGTASDNSEKLQEQKNGTRLDKLGMELKDLTPEAADQFGAKGKVEGAVLSQVDPDSLAAGAGLERGMLLVKVDGKEVHSAAEAKSALEKGDLHKGVLLQVRAPQGGVRYVVLKATAEK